MCFKCTLKQDLFMLEEYEQLFSLPKIQDGSQKRLLGANSVSIYEVKDTDLSLLPCIFVWLNSQRLSLDMFRLFPSSEP